MKAAIKRMRDNAVWMEPLCRILRTGRVVPETVWKHLAFKGIVDFDVAGRKVRMRHFGAQIENSLFWSGYGHGWEGTSLLVWERLAAESRVIFDVGANSGLYAIAAAAANPHASIHAFEPMPKIAKLLQDNADLNRFDIKVHASAASDCAGTAQIKAMMADHEYSASFEHMDWMEQTETIAVEVPVVRLVDVISASGDQPELVKLDVERHEPQALRGLWDKSNEDLKPLFLIEVLDQDTASAVWSLVSPKGYRAMVIREGVSVCEEPFRATPEAMNWLLIPPAASGAAQKLLESGCVSHAELMATRPGPNALAP